MTAPRFTVVMATYNRGRHILPSVRSVLGQTLGDFELLVIGDACSDATGDVVAGIGDPRLRWINLTERWGTQSGPNNRGIAEARAPLVAYIGHDDIWEPDHLASHARLHDAGGVDVVASGLVAYGTEGSGQVTVHGLFADPGDAARLFLPPSALSHRRGIVPAVGGWRRKEELALPVDRDLQTRLAAAGYRFASTGRIGGHKFVGAVRYLSYLQPSSDEQAAMLARLGEPGHRTAVDAAVEVARRAGRFMSTPLERLRDPAVRGRVLAAIRGLDVAVRPLGQGATIAQTDERRGQDWWKPNPRLPDYRWSGPNPNPRVLVPFTHDGAAAFQLALVFRDRAILPQVLLNGAPVAASLSARERREGLVFATLGLRGPLRTDAPSVIELRQDPARQRVTGTGQRRGLGLGEVRLAPV